MPKHHFIFQTWEKKKSAHTFQTYIVEWKIVKLQAVYEVDTENLERISALTNKPGWNTTMDHISLPNCS